MNCLLVIVWVRVINCSFFVGYEATCLNVYICIYVYIYINYRILIFLFGDIFTSLFIYAGFMV